MAEQSRRTARQSSRHGDAEKRKAPRAAPRRPSSAEVARHARAHMDELVGRPVEGISALRRTDDGWEVRVDVVEMERVPDTTSLLATYELHLDRRCDLVDYRRIARYRRSDTGG